MKVFSSIVFIANDSGIRSIKMRKWFSQVAYSLTLLSPISNKVIYATQNSEAQLQQAAVSNGGTLHLPVVLEKRNALKPLHYKSVQNHESRRYDNKLI